MSRHAAPRARHTVCPGGPFARLGALGPAAASVVNAPTTPGAKTSARLLGAALFLCFSAAPAAAFAAQGSDSPTPAGGPETSVSDQHIRALIEGAAARGHRVTIGGELFSDSMGAPGTAAGTWVGMIEQNAATIATALSVES